MRRAVVMAYALGCNPGGEALGVPVPPDRERHIDERWRNRLLTRDEIMEMDRDVDARRMAAKELS
jgi:hypothetical protein